MDKALEWFQVYPNGKSRVTFNVILKKGDYLLRGEFNTGKNEDAFGAYFSVVKRL